VSRLRDRRQRRGQTLVEFALILPIFLLVLIGIFDFGRAVYSYNTISNAAREAVRLAIVDQNVTAITNEAVDRASSVGIDSSDVTVEFKSADLSTDCVAPYNIGCVAVVTVRYEYNAATPIISNLVGTIDMSAVSRQPIEYVFQSP
jgi:Flp pilus assembly protein TadG